MKRYLLSIVMILAAVGMLAPPSFAVDKEVIELQQSVALLQGMVQDMQRDLDAKIAVMQNQLQQSSTQVTKLSSDLAALQHSIEVSVGNSGQKVDNVSSLIQGLQGSLDDVRARLDDLSQQMGKLQTAQQTIPAAATESANNFGETGGMGTPPTPDVLYNTALRDYTSGNYPLSLQEFMSYLQYYPNTALASSAQYYIGDIYYQQGQFEKAVQEYDKAIEQYPAGDKTAGAQLKKGFALLNLNLRSQGVQELNAVLQKFPNTPEAQLAKEKLDSLPPETSRRGARANP